MHLVRNAVDHGIEPPDERAASGKTEPPTVTLKAYYESNDVLISVTDNGAGMNAQALLNKARSKGILTKPEQEYTEQDCFALIMAAGFSTNEQITEYSGRGVGMDVVKKNLEKVGGALLVDSVWGKGSTFTIRVPMSLSISDCMEIRLGGQEYAVPVSAMAEAFRATPEQLVTTPDGIEMVQKDKLYRIIRLSEHFGIEGCERDCTKGIMLLCRTAQGEAALFADDIVEDMQIVVKPFPAYLAKFGLKEAGFSGTSVLGDGSIILALDVNEILKGGL
jgi:two-component system chemotaxis sensor kinase CheA